MKRKNLFLAAMLIAFAAAAHAVPPLPTGWYLEGNLGITKVSNTSYGSGTSVTSNGAGGSLIGGYKFMPFLAGEVGYTKFAKVTVKNAAGTTINTYKNYAWDLAAKAIVPITNAGFEAFAKVGWSIINSSVSGTSQNVPGLYLGLGGEYFVCPLMPVNLQWARAYGDGRTGNLDLYSIGIGYLFG